jgi:hypothetical protein
MELPQFEAKPLQSLIKKKDESIADTQKCLTSMALYIFSLFYYVSPSIAEIIGSLIEQGTPIENILDTNIRTSYDMTLVSKGTVPCNQGKECVHLQKGWCFWGHTIGDIYQDTYELKTLIDTFNDIESMNNAVLIAKTGVWPEQQDDGGEGNIDRWTEERDFDTWPTAHIVAI